MDRLIMECRDSSFNSSILCPNTLYVWQCLQSAVTNMETKKTSVRNIRWTKILVLTVVHKINPCNSKSHREILLELLGLILQTKNFLLFL